MDKSRKNFDCCGQTGLVSWGGTAFEYLMPNITIPSYESSLLNESCKLLIYSEKKYAQALNTPWGMSESAYSLKDFRGNYQYKTFGVPWLGLKRGLSEEVVVSPYSSALALPFDYTDSIENLRKLDKDGLVNKYGFYDAIDFKPKKEIVKNYMAHHQGMIITSINNCLNRNILVKRFMNNPEMKSINTLLQEKMPEDVIITKEKKEKVEKIKYDGFEKLEPRKKGINIVSTNNMTTILTEDFKGISYIEDEVINDGINVFIKDLQNNNVYDFQKIFSKNNVKELYYENKNEIQKEIEHTIYSSKYTIKDGRIKASVDITIAPDCTVEIRKIEVLNSTIKPIEIEISTLENIWLSRKNTHLSHQTFDNMFLNYRKEKDFLIVNRKPKNEIEKKAFYATALLSENGDMEYEIDKEKLEKRGEKTVPYKIKNSIPFSKKIETTINPIIAMRHLIKINPNKKKEIYLISSANFVEEEAINNLKDYLNKEKLKRVFELSKVQTEAENRYLGLENKEINLYQKIAEVTLYPNRNSVSSNVNLSNEKLWKYGVSGDFPIILIKLKDLNETYLAKEVLKLYDFFLSKNIKTELVFLTEIEMQDILIDTRKIKCLNKREGIFVLKKVSKEDKRVIEARANLVIDPRNGLLKNQIE